MPGFLIDFFFDKQYYMALAIIFIMLYNGEKGKTNKVDGKRRQDIEVYFNGVGQMLPPRQISPDAEKSPKQPIKRSFRTLAGLYIPKLPPCTAGG